VLLLSADCNAAGILLSSQQEAHVVKALQTVDFGVIAGTLQILQAMPEARLPKLVQELQQLQEGSAQAAQQQGHDSYLKLVCLGVRPDSQCNGMGRQLLDLALDRAQQERQLLMADVADMSAIQMLERHGFNSVGSSGLFTQLAWSPL
jgi:ribosomal protein S18 acetylase RimI-like enzyme